MGLPIFECEEAARDIKEGDEIEVNADTGEIKNLSTGAIYKAQPIPSFMQELIRDGGLIAHILNERRQTISPEVTCDPTGCTVKR